MKPQYLWRSDEFPPNCRSTNHVYNFLRKVGGVNNYGENNYLLVIGSEVRTQFAAPNGFEDYLEGEGDGPALEFDPEMVKVPVSTKAAGTRGHEEGFVVEMPRGMHVANKPVRTVKEMRWVERWPNLEGWVIVHWEPGGGGCSKDWWESWKVQGTELNQLGPWPEKGRYWLFAQGIDLASKQLTQVSFPKVPAFDWMERAIAQFEFNRNAPENIANKEFRMLAALSELRDRKMKEAKKRRQEVVDRFAEITKPLLLGSSLEAGRMREDLAKRIKARTGHSLGHVGS